MAQVPYTEEEQSILRRLHGMLEADPLRSNEDFLAAGAALRNAKIPILLLAGKIAEWTGPMSYNTTDAEWDTLTTNIMEFIEKVLENPVKEAPN